MHGREGERARGRRGEREEKRQGREKKKEKEKSGRISREIFHGCYCGERSPTKKQWPKR